jgi:hypothetical protein
MEEELLEQEPEAQGGYQQPEEGSPSVEQSEPEYQIPEGAPEFDANGRRIYYDAESPEGYIYEDEEPVNPPAPKPTAAQPVPQRQQPQSFTPAPVAATAPKPQGTAPVPFAPNVAQAPPAFDYPTWLRDNKDRLTELSILDPIAKDIETAQAQQYASRVDGDITSYIMNMLPADLVNAHGNDIRASLAKLPQATRRDPYQAIPYAMNEMIGLAQQRLMYSGVDPLTAWEQASESIRKLSNKQPAPKQQQQVQTRVNPAAPRGAPSGNGGGSTGAPVGTRSNPQKPKGIPGYPMEEGTNIAKIRGEFSRSVKR